MILCDFAFQRVESFVSLQFFGVCKLCCQSTALGLFAAHCDNRPCLSLHRGVGRIEAQKWPCTTQLRHKGVMFSGHFYLQLGLPFAVHTDLRKLSGS